MCCVVCVLYQEVIPKPRRMHRAVSLPAFARSDWRRHSRSSACPTASHLLSSTWCAHILGLTAEKFSVPGHAQPSFVAASRQKSQAAVSQQPLAFPVLFVVRSFCSGQVSRLFNYVCRLFFPIQLSSLHSPRNISFTKMETVLWFQLFSPIIA